MGFKHNIITRWTTSSKNGALALKSRFNRKQNAQSDLIKQAESIGINWKDQVQALRSRGKKIRSDPKWDLELNKIQDPKLIYPDYYLKPFHAYPAGNLCWSAAFEAEVADQTVHAQLWPEEGIQGNIKLRHNFLKILNDHFPKPPQSILDLGCSVGINTFALQAMFPKAWITGLDLSPHYLAIAQYRSTQRLKPFPERPPEIYWFHAPAEATRYPDNAFDLITAFLVVHELPSTATQSILQEAKRVLRPGGYLSIMDFNPDAEEYLKKKPASSAKLNI